jgi:hypothetical protein
MDEHDEKFDRKDRLLLPQSQDDAKIRHRGLPLNSMLGFRGTDAEGIWQHSQLKGKGLKYLRRKIVGQEESERQMNRSTGLVYRIHP